MGDIVKDADLQGRRKDPSAGRESATVFDEIRWATEDLYHPIENTARVISQFGGPYSGASGSLTNIMGAMAGRNATLQQLTSSAGEAVDLVSQVVGEVQQTGNLINQITASEMSTPFIRDFVTYGQSIHPAVNNYIQSNIGQFPYFEQISEQVGSHFTIISSFSNIDPMFWMGQCGQLPTANLKMASRMGRSLFSKMFNPNAGMLEDSQNLLDSLFIRALPMEENHSATHPFYAIERAIAHGNNFCQDVFHQLRQELSIIGVFGKLVGTFGDRLRLLNQIFPVEYRVQHKEQIYNATVESFPDGPQEIVVDRQNRKWEPRMVDEEKTLGVTEEAFTECPE